MAAMVSITMISLLSAQEVVYHCRSLGPLIDSAFEGLFVVTISTMATMDLGFYYRSLGNVLTASLSALTLLPGLSVVGVIRVRMRYLIGTFFPHLQEISIQRGPKRRY